MLKASQAQPGGQTKLNGRTMTTRWYEPKHSFILMKLDCMLQKIEAIGWCDLEELHDFVTTFRTLPPKHQERYGFLLDVAAEYWDEGVQPCK